MTVIVILAIISLIVIPIVLNVIESAKKGAARLSTINYIKEVNRLNIVELGNPFSGEIEDITDNDWLAQLQLSGTKPTSGSLIIDENGVVSLANFCINNYKVVYENSKATIVGKCSSERNEFEAFDMTPVDLNCQNIDDIRTCYIESIEDLVVFSDMSNGTNGYSLDDFQNTQVILKNSFDINNDLSYVDVNKKWSYDLNKDGKIETLKKELTKGNGFIPISMNSSKPFKGTFDGNGYTISNVTIKGNDYVAMFGYNEGTIRGLNIQNINVTGNQYVAGLVADNKGTVSMINLQGEISGTYAGGIVSKGNYNGSTTKDIIMNGSVSGASSGGLVYNVINLYGIVEAGTYENGLGSTNYRKIAYIDGKVTAGSYTFFTKLSESSYNNISAYNDYVQTILDGANEDGYYFDYNSDASDIIVKKVNS